LIPSPPATSISTKAQGSTSSSVDLNQAAVSQIISQRNQRQFQLVVAAARTFAQRSVFVPQKITVKRAKWSAEREDTLRIVALLTQIERLLTPWAGGVHEFENT
jgi:hypothetical protein